MIEILVLILVLVNCLKYSIVLVLAAKQILVLVLILVKCLYYSDILNNTRTRSYSERYNYKASLFFRGAPRRHLSNSSSHAFQSIDSSVNKHRAVQSPHCQRWRALRADARLKGREGAFDSMDDAGA